jgi:hypothetical protein
VLVRVTKLKSSRRPREKTASALKPGGTLAKAPAPARSAAVEVCERRPQDRVERDGALYAVPRHSA